MKEQNIPMGSITNPEALAKMTEADARAHLDAALETLSFEDRAELLKRLGGLS